MGSRGPVPDPNSARSKAGRNTKYRPPVKVGPIARPDHLNDIPAAAELWDRVAGQLVADGRLTTDRVESFAILCRIYAEIRQLEDLVVAEGFVTATDKGQAASPAAKLLRDSRRDFVSLAREFGMTAAAAARIPQEMPADGEGDEEDAILAKLSIKR